MNKKALVRFMIFRTLGNFLILLTIFGFLATFGPAVYYEVSYRVAKLRGVSYVLADDVSKASGETELGKLLRKYRDQGETRNQAPSLLADVISNAREQVLIPPSAEFSIVIPKIGAAASVTANVDPSNKDEYLRVLQHSIAHAKGTAYPGVNGTTYLFAHSADNFWNIGRYNAVFYLLKELETGDDVYLFFRGKRHNYEVYDKKIVDSKEVEYVDAALGLGERIILQTCWPPGTDWKRTLVFARPKSA